MTTEGGGSNTLTSINTRAGGGNRYLQFPMSLYVSNKPGVLIRIALVFARRGYNIDSLVVSEANDPDFSWMHIVASGDEATLEQILHQLEKLVDVVEAQLHISDNPLERELALAKLQCSPDERTEVLQIIHALSGQIADISENTITLQITGSTNKVDTFHTMLKKFTILKFIRTGKVMIPRGEEGDGEISTTGEGGQGNG